MVARYFLSHPYNTQKEGHKMTLTPYKRKAFYYETDRMDIIHHSNYVRWLEEARVDLRRTWHSFSCSLC